MHVKTTPIKWHRCRLHSLLARRCSNSTVRVGNVNSPIVVNTIDQEYQYTISGIGPSALLWAHLQRLDSFSVLVPGVWAFFFH